MSEHSKGSNGNGVTGMVVAPNSGDVVRQGFGSTEIERKAETAAAMVAAQSKAAVEARYILAMRAPRNMDTVRTRLLNECSRPAFAEVARYHKPVGKGVEGPSIRFVEAALRAMGNTYPEVVVVYDDPDKRIIQVSVTDLETNYTVSKQIVISKTLERSNAQGRPVVGTRENSYGRTTYIVKAQSDDEMLDKYNAEESKALRNCGLRIIPGGLVAECMARVVAVQNDQAARDPDTERHKIADAFNQLGIEPIDLTEYLGHDLAKSSPAELVELRGIWMAIDQGEATWRDALDHKRHERGETEDAPTGKGVAAVKGRIAQFVAKNEKAEADRTGKAEAEPPANQPIDAEAESRAQADRELDEVFESKKPEPEKPKRKSKSKAKAKNEPKPGPSEPDDDLAPELQIMVDSYEHDLGHIMTAADPAAELERINIAIQKLPECKARTRLFKMAVGAAEMVDEARRKAEQ